MLVQVCNLVLVSDEQTSTETFRPDQVGPELCGPDQQACCGGLAEFIPARIFKALSDPNRIAILAQLAICQPATVGKLAECCPINLSVVSRHLAVLREAGVVKCEKRGREVFCTVDVEAVATSLRQLADALETCCPPSNTSGAK